MAKFSLFLLSLIFITFISCSTDDDTEETGSPDNSEVTDSDAEDTVEKETVDNDAVDETWFEGDEKLEPAFNLDCQVPEKIFTNAAPDFGIIQFKGELYQNTNGNAPSGEHAYLIKLNGNEINMDSESAQGFYVPKDSGNDVITVQSVGNVVELVAQKHYTYTLSQLNIGVSALEDVKKQNDEGGYLMNNGDERNYIFITLDFEQKYGEEGQYFQKRCVKTIDDLSNEYATIYACTGGNDAFELGETLQIAASFGLTDDESVLLPVHDPLCICFDSKAGEMDCAEFDNIQP